MDDSFDVLRHTVPEDSLTSATQGSLCQWRSQGGGGGHGGHAPPKLLVNFRINLRCYVLLGCRVQNVILACLKNQY